MIFLVYSEFTAETIKDNLGAPDYSYYFVMRDFLPVLQKIGTVIMTANPAAEADALHEEAAKRNETSILLSFAPPQKTVLGLKCPTVPVFAWEFDSIPSEPWLDDEKQNWRFVFEHCPAAITHSQLTVEAVKKVMGNDYPVISIPSPVWDKYASLRKKRQDNAFQAANDLTVAIDSGVVLDTHDLSLAPYLPGPEAVEKAIAAARTTEQQPKPQPAPSVLPFVITRDKRLLRLQSRWQITRRFLIEFLLRAYREHVAARRTAGTPPPVENGGGNSSRMEPHNPVEPGTLAKTGLEPDMPEWHYQPHTLKLSGTVFTALFNPYDGRKNWVDMLTAFCSAFRDQAKATLVFKLGHHEYQSAVNDMLMCMARMPEFKCRVVIIQGYLDHDAFDALIQSTTFVLNASHGEGQCLPLMEFLSCGIPAIAPKNSAMLDYIDNDVAFVVDSWIDATAWSHDPRLAYRTLRHQINWESLVSCFGAAFHCANNDREKYQQMAQNAVTRMQGHCSQAIACEALKRIVTQPELSRA